MLKPFVVNCFLLFRPEHPVGTGLAASLYLIWGVQDIGPKIQFAVYL
jgi:hypothetical protein